MKPLTIEQLEEGLTLSISAQERDTATLEKLEAQLAAVVAQREILRTAKAKADEWGADSRAQPPKPQPLTLGAKPIAPKGEMPSDEDLRWSTRILEEERQAITIRAERARARTAANAALCTATDAHRAAVKEQARCEALLSAVRRAPGAILDAQVAALGDLGNVRIRALDSSKGPCLVFVVVDEHGEHPWGPTGISSGQKVLADASFRDALRRARKVTSLPLIIDDTVLWDGPVPRCTGAVWRLVRGSTPDGAIIVRGAL